MSRVLRAAITAIACTLPYAALAAIYVATGAHLNATPAAFALTMPAVMGAYIGWHWIR